MICLISLQSSPKLKEIASILKAPSMIILWEKVKHKYYVHNKDYLVNGFKYLEVKKIEVRE